MIAPVCPVSRSQAVAAMPAVRVPSIPVAVDLPSAIAALNQIITLLPQVIGPLPSNNLYPALPVPSPANGGGKLKKPRWVEQGRNMPTMRISNADDNDAWVEIDVIEQIIWRDETSGNTLVWEMPQ